MAAAVFYKILKAIKAREPESLEFDNLEPEDSALVLESLIEDKNCFEIYHFRIHFSAPDRHLRIVQPSNLRAYAASWLNRQFQGWIVHGLIDRVAIEAISVWGSPRIECFTGTYAGSVKEPDACMIPRGPGESDRRFPSVVLEFGWTSPEPEPVDYRRLWQEGSGGQVRVVIFVKLCRPNAQNEIRAAVEISHCTPGTGAVTTTTQIDVFPVPNPIPADPTITMDEIFSGHCPPGLNPETMLGLGVDDLRRNLKMVMAKSGYVPA